MSEYTLMVPFIYMSHHSYAKSEREGEVRMHRRITTEAVEDFAIHTPRDEVDVLREEDIVYTRGVLTHAAGTTMTKILLQVSFLSIKVVYTCYCITY